MARYEAGESDDESVQGDILARYETRIAELERKVGQLVMENGWLKKKTPGCRCNSGYKFGRGNEL